MADLLKNLEIVHPAAAALSPEDFALLRRQGLGASDASIYLGLQTKWRNTEDLIRNKLAVTLTEEEKIISKKVAVRLGHATEDTNLAMFSEIMELTAAKDPAMYRHKTYPYLTINFDGICIENDMLIPVEAKLIGVFADKYWGFDKGIGRKETDEQDHIISAVHDQTPSWITAPMLPKTNVIAHCEAAATAYGIPGYYYAQIQQQCLGLDAPYGYFTALRLKKMEHHVFKVWADEWLQKEIVLQGYKTWERIRKRQSLT